MKSKQLKKLLAGAMSLVMAFSVSGVAFADTDTSAEPTTTTWKALYEGLGVDTSMSGDGYYDAVTSASKFTSHHAKDIPSIVNKVLDENGAVLNLDGVNLTGKEATVAPKVGEAYWESFAGKQPNKTYGTDELVIKPDESVEGYSWDTYLSTIYAVTISDGNSIAGAVPWIDYYGEATGGNKNSPHHNKIEIALNSGMTVSDNKSEVHRYDAFYTDGVLNPGMYTVTVYSEGYEPLTAEIKVPTVTKATVAAADADVAATSTSVTFEGLPEDYVPSFTIDGTPAEYANGAVSFSGLAIGTHTLTVIDTAGKYNNLTTTFTVKTDEVQAAFNSEEQKIFPAEGISEAAFGTYISKISTVTINGARYSAAGRGSVKVIDNAGNIDLSKTAFADVAGELNFTVTAPGYPDLAFVYKNYVSLEKAVMAAIPVQTFANKALKPAAAITLGDIELEEGTDYTLSYDNNKNVGTANVTATGAGFYTGSISGSFTIKKANQPLKVTPVNKTYKVAKVKKSAKTFKAVIVKGNKVKVTYKSAPTTAKAKKALKFNAKTGKITVKKGTKKGTYKTKITVTSAATSNYNKATKTVTVKIVVK